MWWYSNTEQEYYSGKRVNLRMGIGNQGNSDNVWSITSEERCGQIVH